MKSNIILHLLPVYLKARHFEKWDETEMVFELH